MTRAMPTIIAWLFLLLLAPTVAAHEIRPAIVDIDFDGEGEVEVTIRLNLEAAVAGISPKHADTNDSPQAATYNRLRELPPEALRTRFEAAAPGFLAHMHLAADEVPLQPALAHVEIPPVGDVALARDSQVTVTAALPAGVRSVTWGWDALLGPVIVRARAQPRGPVTYTVYLKDGADTAPIPATGPTAQSWLDVSGNYLTIGFTHIVPKGLDHILFVVGLFLLSTHFRPLAWQITAFTVAHSVTLALGVLGLVRLSPAVVEPLIAASIVYVAVENVISDKLQRWRPAVVFCFGLLHGLGFAGVLAEVGLQRDQFLTGLISFNLGVELGQLFVVSLCFATVGLWFRHKSFYRGAITIPASLAIAGVGAWWFIERVGLV